MRVTGAGDPAGSSREEDAAGRNPPRKNRVMSTPPHVVVAEDDPFVQELLAAHLRSAGFRATAVATGHELLSTLDSAPTNVVLLDLGLPDEDGLVLMRQIRARSSIPVVVLTARKSREDRISALELGADDYLTKPCDPAELVLRLRNLLNRYAGPREHGRKARSEVLRFRSWTMDLAARTVTDAAGTEISLSRSEFNLLSALARAANRVMSRGQLLDAICQYDSAPSERMIDVLIARLRRKLEANARKPEIIKTVVGLGYKFSVDVSHPASGNKKRAELI